MMHKMDNNHTRNPIKEEIIEVVGKYGFWIMTKNDMQGCAGYIHTENRKVYVEILFPDNYPVKPIILNMPRDLRQNPIFLDLLPQLIEETKKWEFTAAKVVELIKLKITTLPAPAVKESLVDELEEELNLVKSIYNVKIVEGKKYHIRIFYQLESDLNFEIEINYKDYPRKPGIKFHHGLGKIIRSPQALDVIRNWNASNPPHIIQIVQEIEQKFTATHGIEDSEKLITIKNLTIINEKNQMLTQNLSFIAIKGDIIGIFCYNEHIPMALFRLFLGDKFQLEGTVNFFGNASIDAFQERIEIIDFELPSSTAETINCLSLDKIFEKFLLGLKKKDARDRINTFLSIIGLSNRRKLRMEDLSEGEKRRVILAFSLINLPSVALLVEPEKGLNATEKKRIWESLTAINDKFSITMFVYSMSEEIKRCHNILVLSREGKQLGFGTLPQLVGELPLQKEVIVTQFKTPNPKHTQFLGKVPGVTFIIEERQGEKYRIFTKNDPSKVIPYIFQELGTNLYNISKELPSLIDYVPFKRVQKRNTQKIS